MGIAARVNAINAAATILPGLLETIDANLGRFAGAGSKISGSRPM
jgi:hypothetical protein|tara:strand:- start:3665 stop:3799 length:135 start_codon:yes stop_codon:yes gene_type:complete